MSIQITLERVENLKAGDIFRTARSGTDDNFDRSPWRQVLSAQSTGLNSVRVLSTVWPAGEALERFELVQMQTHD